MKLFWLTLLSAIMFASCALASSAPQKVPQKARTDMIFSDKEAAPMVEESVVEVAVLPNDLVLLDLSRWGKPELQLLPKKRQQDHQQDRLMENIDQLVEELCDRIEQEAWRGGFRSLLHGFVRKGIVLQPLNHPDQGEILIFHEGSRLTGYCRPLWDEPSGRFTHDVHFEATLLPLRHFAGVIDALHDGYTMAGGGSRAYVTLTDPTCLSAPLPALIVQWQKGLGPEFVRVIGSGVITQIFGSQGQMEILESTKEIVAGDMFFVLQVKGRLVQDRGMEAPYSPGMWRGIPAVTVRPAPE